jgi:hypothetical protein
LAESKRAMVWVLGLGLHLKMYAPFLFFFFSFFSCLLFPIQLQKFNAELTQFMKDNYPPNLTVKHRLFVVIVKEKN